MIKLRVYYKGGQNYPAVQLDGFSLILELHTSSKANHSLWRFEILYIFSKRNFA